MGLRELGSRQALSGHTLIRVGRASEREREKEIEMAILPGDREGIKPHLQIPRLKYFRVM